MLLCANTEQSTHLTLPQLAAGSMFSQERPCFHLSKPLLPTLLTQHLQAGGSEMAPREPH